MNRFIPFLLALGLVVSAVPAFAVSLFLKDGSIIEGTIVRETAKSITVSTEGKAATFDRKAILRMLYDTSYKQKKYIYLKNGKEIIGYVVGEDRDSVYVRKDLDNARELTLRKNTINGILLTRVDTGKTGKKQGVSVKRAPHLEINLMGGFGLVGYRDEDLDRYRFQALIAGAGLQWNFASFARNHLYGFAATELLLGKTGEPENVATSIPLGVGLGWVIVGGLFLETSIGAAFSPEYDRFTFNWGSRFGYRFYPVDNFSIQISLHSNLYFPDVWGYYLGGEIGFGILF